MNFQNDLNISIKVTNEGCGYKRYAYLLPVNETALMCIGFDASFDAWELGEIVLNSEITFESTISLSTLELLAPTNQLPLNVIKYLAK